MGADGQPVERKHHQHPGAYALSDCRTRLCTDDGYTTPDAAGNAFGIIDVVNEEGRGRRADKDVHEYAPRAARSALSKVLKGNATDGEKEFTFRVKLENARFDTATQRDAYDVVIREKRTRRTCRRALRAMRTASMC